MVKRAYSTEDKEPESNFKLPSEIEHTFQVVDVNPFRYPDGSADENIQIVKLEIVGGAEEGLTLLNRCNLDQDEKAFYFTRLFLKAIGEPYKGEFDIDPDRWIGKVFSATVKHTQSKDGKKTYANIDTYNFDKVIEQYKPPVGSTPPVADPKDIQWEN